MSRERAPALMTATPCFPMPTNSGSRGVVSKGLASCCGGRVYLNRSGDVSWVLNAQY